MTVTWKHFYSRNGVVHFILKHWDFFSIFWCLIYHTNYLDCWATSILSHTQIYVHVCTHKLFEVCNSRVSNHCILWFAHKSNCLENLWNLDFHKIYMSAVSKTLHSWHKPVLNLDMNGKRNIICPKCRQMRYIYQGQKTWGLINLD